MTIVTPVLLLVLLAIFAVFQLRSPWLHMRRTFDEVKQKVILILSFSFSVLSIFFLKTVVQGFVCTRDNFLHSQPEVVCDTNVCEDGVCYRDIVNVASVGLCIYIVAAAIIVAAVVKLPDRFFFWSDKWCVPGLITMRFLGWLSQGMCFVCMCAVLCLASRSGITGS